MHNAPFRELEVRNCAKFVERVTRNLYTIDAYRLIQALPDVDLQTEIPRVLLELELFRNLSRRCSIALIIRDVEFLFFILREVRFRVYSFVSFFFKRGFKRDYLDCKE